MLNSIFKELILLSIFGISTFLAFYSYNQIEKSKVDSIFLNDFFKAGTNKHQFLVNNQKFGSIEEELVKDAGFYDYQNTGNINLQIHGKPQVVNFKTALVFNEIDQLGVGVLKFWFSETVDPTVLSNKADLTISSTGVDPMNIKVSLPEFLPPQILLLINTLLKKDSDNKNYLEFQMPGPITLIDNSVEEQNILKKSYGLRWSYLSEVLNKGEITKLDTLSLALTNKNIPNIQVVRNVIENFKNLKFEVQKENEDLSIEPFELGNILGSMNVLETVKK